PLGARRRVAPPGGELQPLALASLEQGARAGHDLLHVDRFDDEVVSAGLETAGLVLDARLGDQHHGGRQAIAGSFGAPAQLQVGGPRDHQVGPVGQTAYPLFRRRGQTDGEARVAEAVIQDAAESLVLLDDQDRLRRPLRSALRLHLCRYRSQYMRPGAVALVLYKM